MMTSMRDFFTHPSKEKFIFYDTKYCYRGWGVKEHTESLLEARKATIAFSLSPFDNKKSSDIFKSFSPGFYIPCHSDIISKNDMMCELIQDVGKGKAIIQAWHEEPFKNLFFKAMESISKEELTKVVITREVVAQEECARSLEALWSQMVQAHPESYCFLFQKEDTIFLGATPELLVKQEKNQFELVALAGSAVKSEKSQEWLMNSAKNRFEHQLVVESIYQKTLPYAESIHQNGPEVVRLKHLDHLKTVITLKSEESIDFFKNLLHPTPALGGIPEKEAFNFIRDYEEHSRGYFGAPIGVITPTGGIYVVAIRSGVRVKNRWYLYAGCGIVLGSTWESESQESLQKLKTMLEIIGV